jgi:protein-L-isoaspartate(D-aspartate) O-methyltransferase
MSDYAAVRHTMVESQLRTNEVSEPRLVEALEAVPREAFVPEPLRGIAYVDEDLEVAPARFLMEPRVLALLLQAANLEATDVVLDVGCLSGYSTALLARLADTVVGLESDAELARRADELISTLGVDNAAVVTGPLAEGYAKQAPYDVILVGGAVPEVSAALIDQLAEGGRLLTILRPPGAVGHAALMLRRHGQVSTRVLFDAAVPALPGFERKPGFVF